MTQIAERFTPYGSSFQVGQAVNRSKWGAWGEIGGSHQQASEILRRFPGVEVIGSRGHRLRVPMHGGAGSSAGCIDVLSSLL